MKWLLPWTLPALASKPTSQEGSQGDIWTHAQKTERKRSNNMEFRSKQEQKKHRNHSTSQKHFKRKRILNQYKTWFFQRGSCVKATCKKTWNPKFPQSVLDIFSSSKYEVISSLNSTCSCLYVYFSRRLPRRHLDTEKKEVEFKEEITS